MLISRKNLSPYYVSREKHIRTSFLQLLFIFIFNRTDGTGCRLQNRVGKYLWDQRTPGNTPILYGSIGNVSSTVPTLLINFNAFSGFSKKLGNTPILYGSIGNVSNTVSTLLINFNAFSDFNKKLNTNTVATNVTAPFSTIPLPKLIF